MRKTLFYHYIFGGYFLMILFFVGCSSIKKFEQSIPQNSMNLLEELLKTEPQNFSMLLKHRDSFRLQIIYTQINRDQNNKPHFTDYTFNLNSNQYFYPASTVKLPVALLALQRLKEINIAGVDRNTTMITDSSYHRQEAIYNHPPSLNGKPSIAQYIKEILLVSDNDAYNRLYEFLGQEYINEQLKTKEYNDVQILHRLNIALSPDENRNTNAISFYDILGSQLYHQPAKVNRQIYARRDDKLGSGYYKNGVLVNEPFDFSLKNKISLSNLHSILKTVIFPESADAKSKFNINKDDYSFLLKYMSATPHESNLPLYNPAKYNDAYVKFLLLGNKDSLPKSVRIFNKVGDAYGFLTDVAYIVDFDKKIEFMLSATLLCNSDGIFNDDKYDYDTVGFPFMKNVGALIYNYENQRKKQFLPNLDAFRINYNEVDNN